MLSGEWNRVYYCCASQLERKNPHMTFRATAFPLWFLFSFSSLPPALNHTMNANASVIPLRQEISLFLNDATVWSHPVSVCLSLSPHSDSNVNWVIFKKRKILADRKMPLKNITDVVLQWTRHHTCMQKHTNDLEFDFHGLFVSWCVCGKKESSWTETRSPQLDMNRYNLELHLTHHSVTLYYKWKRL